MTKPSSTMTARGYDGKESASSPSREASARAAGPNDVPETAMVTIGAILNLFRLAAADLVLHQPGCDMTRFEQAVRTKIDQFTSPAASQSARDAGLAFARHLTEQVLTQIRAQAEVKRSLTRVDANRQGPLHGDEKETGVPRLLN
jgi:hypothetical protein